MAEGSFANGRAANPCNDLGIGLVGFELNPYSI
jgi:hypothetical protein